MGGEAIKSHQWLRVVRLAGGLEAELAAADTAALGSHTARLRQQSAGGSNLDVVVSGGLAVAREAIRRAHGIEISDEDLTAAVAVHSGHVAQVDHSLGRLLVPAVAAYLCAVAGERVHVMTVSDSAATSWVAELRVLFEMLNVSAATVNPGMAIADRQAAYRSEVVYGSYEEFGFDYLRDNLAWEPAEQVRAHRDRAILDEADWVLVDHARLPLIIGVSAEPDHDRYRRMSEVAAALQPQTHYRLDEQTGMLALTTEGNRVAALALGVDLTQSWHAGTLRRLEDAVRSIGWYRDGVDFSSSGNSLRIDQRHSRRLKDDPRLATGVRQALETHLRLPVTDERIELARIPVIEYLRKYRHVCGVSPVAGLADQEFRALYGLTAAVPTATGTPRGASPDRLFYTGSDRDRAVTEQAKKLRAEGHQVLIGAPTQEDSIRISELLSRDGTPQRVIGVNSAAGSLPDPVLVFVPGDARGDEPIATGLTNQVRGKLAALGAGRNLLRRTDEWLVSLAHGDDPLSPTHAQFFLSRQDPLQEALHHKSFARPRKSIRARGNGAAIDDRYARLTLEAQEAAAKRALEAKLKMTEFGKAEAAQREEVYTTRSRALDSSSTLDNLIAEVLDTVADRTLQTHPNLEDLLDALTELYPSRLTTADLTSANNATDLEPLVKADIRLAHKTRENQITPEVMRRLERQVIVAVIDLHWRNHLANLDAVRDALATSRRSFDEMIFEFHKDADHLFREMQRQIAEDIARHILNANLAAEP